MKSPTAEHIAEAFRKIISEWLDEKTVKAIDSENKSNSDGTCATHNFCDANMAMMEAFEGFGIDPLPEDDAEREAMTDLWNRAWNIAKEQGFSKINQETK